MKTIILTFLTVLIYQAYGQIEVFTDGAKTPWTNIQVNDRPGEFRFAVVSDRTGGMRAGIFAEAVTKINLLQPEFVMSVGDLIDGYSEDPDLIKRQWTEFEEIISRFEMPFFRVPGNHDISNAYLVQEWVKRFGQTYYHFRYNDVLFICINTEDPPPKGIGEVQAAYIKTALNENSDVRCPGVGQRS